VVQGQRVCGRQVEHEQLRGCRPCREADPFERVRQFLLVKKGSPITNEAEPKGKKVGVIKGTTNETFARKVPGVGQIITYDGKPEMFDALIDGKLDAVVVDTPFALYNAKSTGKTRIAKELTTGDQYGIAVRKGNTKLLEDINEAMTTIRKDGTYDKLYQKYFGDKI